MFRLIATTLAGIYVVLAVWGVEPGGPTPRAASLTTALGPAAAEASSTGEPAPMATSSALRDVSASEAVEMALAAGEAEAPEARVTEAAARPAPAPAEAAPEAPMWYVTGSNVNLRAGPSSDTRVVGEVGLDDRAEPLSDPTAAWIRIRTEAGAEAYIYGRFLSETPA